MVKKGEKLSQELKDERARNKFSMDTRRFIELLLENKKANGTIEELRDSCIEAFANFDKNNERPAATADKVALTGKIRARVSRLNSQLKAKGHPTINMPRSAKSGSSNIDDLWNEFGADISKYGKK